MKREKNWKHTATSAFAFEVDLNFQDPLRKDKKSFEAKLWSSFRIEKSLNIFIWFFIDFSSSITIRPKSRSKKNWTMIIDLRNKQGKKPANYFIPSDIEYLKLCQKITSSRNFWRVWSEVHKHDSCHGIVHIRRYSLGRLKICNNLWNNSKLSRSWTGSDQKCSLWVTS